MRCIFSVGWCAYRGSAVHNFYDSRKKAAPNRMSDNRFFSFVLYKRGLIALREISAKISEKRRALNKIQLLRGRKRCKFLTTPVVYYYKYKKRPDF